jgi:hypothetical protein
MMRTVLWSSLDRGAGTAAVDDPTDELATPSEIGEAEATATKHGGPNPFAIVGTALVAGAALAKWIDWRGRTRAD